MHPDLRARVRVIRLEDFEGGIEKACSGTRARICDILQPWDKADFPDLRLAGHQTLEICKGPFLHAAYFRAELYKN